MTAKNLESNPDLLGMYANLDDYDVFTSIKVWAEHSDVVLSRLCKGMVNRDLYKIRLRKDPISPTDLEEYQQRAVDQFKISKKESEYFAFSGSITNSAYDPTGEPIQILYRDGTLAELIAASDQMDVAVLSMPIQKHYICVLQELIPLP